MPVPADRIRTIHSAPPKPSARYVLYWMVAFRRMHSNYALDRAVEWCHELSRPLLIVEVVHIDDRWSSRRQHQFLVDGMLETCASGRRAGVTTIAFIERRPGDAAALFQDLARQACVIVTDDAPMPDLRPRLARLATSAPVLVEGVDSNGLLPLAASARPYVTARSYRAFLQKRLPQALETWPGTDPLQSTVLRGAAIETALVTRRDLDGIDPRSGAMTDEPPARSASLDALKLDHRVDPVPSTHGGARAAAQRLRQFIGTRLERYDTDRNVPDISGSSALSPYLRAGHLSAHDVFSAVMTREGWTRRRLGAPAGGARDGWWQVSAPANAFLDQFVTWRELGYVSCWHDEHEHDCRSESLPQWAKATLRAHVPDAREVVYSYAQFESAQTHDVLWNAAQRQLRCEGVIHNYLRMLWGKKILEWSASPDEALATMRELNNRYALDGRDPNSASGILWVLGKYDRPWAPERAVFGTVRFMSSQNTQRKTRVRDYLARYGDPDTSTRHIDLLSTRTPRRPPRQ